LASGVSVRKAGRGSNAGPAEVFLTSAFSLGSAAPAQKSATLAVALSRPSKRRPTRWNDTPIGRRATC